MSDKSKVWSSYIAKYNEEPKGASQLQAFCKKDDSVPTINFKEAKEIYEANVGKGSGPSGAQSEESKESDVNPLFAALNKGGAITKGLKKVTRDMTNKDKAISGKVDESVVKKKKAPAKKTAAPKKVKPPTTRKQGFRIWVENYIEGLVEIKDAGLKNEVYICNCKNAGFKIDPKVKTVTVDTCSKIQVEINEVLTSVDMINAKECTLYLRKTAPTVNIDKCAGPRVVMFQELVDKKPQIITSMTSDMNLTVPGQTEDDDMKDVPIPYQYITTIDPETKKVETVAMSHMG